MTRTGSAGGGRLTRRLTVLDVALPPAPPGMDGAHGTDADSDAPAPQRRAAPLTDHAAPDPSDTAARKRG
jgi:hypothetical protein